MKTNIKARITCLFISKTTINLLYNFYFRQTAILFLSLSYFTPFLLNFPSFFPYLFRFNFVVSERNVKSFLPTYLGGTFFPLLSVSERNFFSGGAGRCTCNPPAYAPVRYTQIEFYIYKLTLSLTLLHRSQRQNTHPCLLCVGVCARVPENTQVSRCIAQ